MMAEKVTLEVKEQAAFSQFVDKNQSKPSRDRALWATGTFQIHFKKQPWNDIVISWGILM